MLTVIDTQAGNFGSILNALCKKLGASVEVTRDKDAIAKAKAIVLPGVASFKQGMAGLNSAGLVEVIRKQALDNRIPTIGICLGMQLLADTGTEGGNAQAGLGLISGQVTRLTSTDANYRVPNIGWHDVVARKRSVLFPEDYTVESFYHVHSYHMQCTNPEDVAASIEFSGQDIVVAVQKDNICGVQFHPEKSQDAGLDLLERFLKSVR